VGSAREVYVAAAQSRRRSELGMSSPEVGQVASCEPLHKGR